MVPIQKGTEGSHTGVQKVLIQEVQRVLIHG